MKLAPKRCAIGEDYRVMKMDETYEEDRVTRK